MTEVKDPFEVLEFLTTLPFGTHAPERKRTSRQDFTERDRPLHVRRLDADYSHPCHVSKDSFGTYMGKMKGYYVVGIKNFASWEIESLELFETLDELKEKWELD